MVEQFKKTSMERDMILIHQHMQRTFALRHEGTVNSAPPCRTKRDDLHSLVKLTSTVNSTESPTNKKQPKRGSGSGGSSE
ncbi:hypothetical protein JOB18_021438 [Solea senegalensis]|uniref:Uncharacterized protein n=1 Tax=Solea senegalensis TaxID=28829 RepID=A0AAV6PM90_SOLSE|nr:hypothetical protein JOB18_021438 [Solea senegalensis]